VQTTRFSGDELKAGTTEFDAVFQYWPSTTPPLATKRPVDMGATDDVDDVIVIDADDSLEEAVSVVEEAVSEVEETCVSVDEDSVTYDDDASVLDEGMTVADGVETVTESGTTERGKELEGVWSVDSALETDWEEPDTSAETEMEGIEIGVTGALEVAKEEVDDLAADEEATRDEVTRRLDVETLETWTELLDTRLDLLVDVVNGLDEVTTATLEVLDDIAETTLDEDFDEVDEIFDEDLDDALLATFEELDEVFVEVFDEVFVEALLVVELDDDFVDGFVDELFDEDLVETFVDEAVTFLDDVLLVGVETALPSTHVHSLTKSLAEYLMNGDVVLGLGPCQ
jgi:hypothetical protein